MASLAYAKAYPKQAAYYVVTVEPHDIGRRVETMDDAQDIVMAAELRGYASYVEVVFTDGSTQALAL